MAAAIIERTKQKGAVEGDESRRRVNLHMDKDLYSQIRNEAFERETTIRAVVEQRLRQSYTAEAKPPARAAKGSGTKPILRQGGYL